MLTEKVCDRTCCSVVSDMLELRPCLLCKACRSKMPDRAVTGIAHGDLVLLRVVDEILNGVETVVLCVYRDGRACAVYHHDRLKHGICKSCVCPHSLKCRELYRDHGNGSSVCRGIGTRKHACRSAAAGTVLNGNILEGALRCVC